jgi:hypothetical protein
MDYWSEGRFTGLMPPCWLKSLLDERVSVKAAVEPGGAYPARRRFGHVTKARLTKPPQSPEMERMVVTRVFDAPRIGLEASRTQTGHINL